MHRVLRRLGALVLVAVAAMTLTTGSAAAAPIRPADLSPAGCDIVYVDDAHDSESTPGVVKVNAKSQCKAKVTELTLSVSIIDIETHVVVAKTPPEKVVNKAFIMNQSTYVRCKDTRTPHLLEGTALGTSYENGRLYDQIKVGRISRVNCTY